MYGKMLMAVVIALALSMPATLPAQQGKPAGSAPRAPGKCVINDLHTAPDVFKEGTHITRFVLDITCDQRMPDVNIEIWHQFESGEKDELAAAYNLELKAGKHAHALNRNVVIKRGGGHFVMIIKRSGGELIVSRSERVKAVGWTIK